MQNIKIKSCRGDYFVKFGKSCWEGEFNEDDYFVIDNNILFRYPLFPVSADNLYVVNAGEELKTLEKSFELLNFLAERDFSGRLIAIGGGTVQDLVGFVSSLWNRGSDWIFIPTTLLAMGDSCIGGKTSINFGGVKNRLGTFHPPKKIFIDLQFLESLNDFEIQSGMGEMMHYFIYANKAPDKDMLKTIVESLEIKKSVIQNDEFGKNERRLFNYGHTFGHALEHATDYKISHGTAVVWGMRFANFIAIEKGIMDEGVNFGIEEMLREYSPHIARLTISFDKFRKSLLKDKKNRRKGFVNCILASSPGQLFETQLPIDDIMSKLEKFLENYT
jgi:3-dehydroquinate synthase